ncbi:glycoside hydrolase family 71/99-like protein [Mucilaginibacter sp.]|uniref:glycoside hydrolase family 71/99-like protein n=1 Tax=Mucilaginibacter sp. TaxID=1882438 RepID=UPI002627C1D1|nr:glycoside hydrolase family 71/99-like protein [Mucilaginibacter sp.]
MLKRSILLLLAVFAVNGVFAQTKHSQTSKHTSYKGLLMAGYQGWHDTPTDGANRGWGHYLQRGVFGPGNLKIDLWPELNEYKKMYPTPFIHADSSVAMLPSDHDYTTTDVRFKWMKQYGVDGVFMQRFIGNTRPGNTRNHFNKVLGDALKAARKYNRAIAVMYDFSGMRDTLDLPLFKSDWKNLVDSMKITSGGNKQPYLYHNGKPLVVLWGVGFNDSGRHYTTKTMAKIVDFLQNDPEYGHCAVMLGVPTYWREFGNDTEKNPELHALIKKVDVIHPWTVGRYKDDAGFQKYNEIEKADLAWCKANHIDYAPTCFPGFSWHNLNLKDKFNAIPRNRGNFFWNELSAAIKNGAEMIYVAMFDEVDEGTAIMKVSQNPPIGPSPFVTFEEGIPSDYYLYLAGYAGKVLKKELPLPESIPLPKSAKSAIK